MTATEETERGTRNDKEVEEEVQVQVSESLQLSGNVYDNFMNNMSYLSKVTQGNYIFAIKKFMQYLKVERIEDLLPPNSNSNNPPTYADIRLIESTIMSYLSQLKKERVSRGTAVGYLSAYTLFFDVNGYTLNGKRLARSLPPKQKLSKDRGYTREEIAMMLQGADERLRAIL